MSETTYAIPVAVTATEFKQNFGKYLDAVNEHDINITKNGKIAAVFKKPSPTEWLDQIDAMVKSVPPDPRWTRAYAAKYLGIPESEVTDEVYNDYTLEQDDLAKFEYFLEKYDHMTLAEWEKQQGMTYHQFKLKYPDRC